MKETTVVACLFVLLHSTLAVKECPSDWNEFKDSCYWDSTLTTYGFSSAERKCEEKGGYLVEINDQEENDFIARMVFGAGYWFWMGITHKESCGGFVTERDNKRINYTYWNPDQERDDDDLCVRMGYLGYWEQYDCDEPQYYICESDNGYISRSSFDYMEHSNTFSYNGHDYRTIGTTASFEDAKKSCAKAGSYLFESNTADENKYVHDKMHEAFYGQWRYIGGNDETSEGNFVWQHSNADLSFQNWWPGEPNDAGYGGEDCMEMRYWGKWNDVSCSEDNRYICEMDLDNGDKDDDCVTEGNKPEKPKTTEEPRKETTTDYYYY